MPPELRELFSITALMVGALFPIVNPLGSAPIFLGLTQEFGASARAILSRKIAINGLLLLIVSILIGSHILGFFGISIPVVQVGGGLVVLATGWDLLHRHDGNEDHADAGRAVSAAELSQKAFYPLTLPLTVGPGSISVAITVGANRHLGPQANWPFYAAVLIGPAIVALSIYLCYRYAENIAKALGPTAMNVILRLSSFILMCIGVQILWNGIRELIKSL
jgi:multiple antibiotic resistance protein